MIKRLLINVLLVLCLLPAAAQTINKPKLDSLMDAIAAHQQAMGSLAIAQNGTLIYQKAIGQAALQNGQPIPANTGTKYRIGSVTKMFTAAMIFQLIGENKLSLATRLSAYFPQVPNASKITIGMMLAHRSGIHNFTSDPLYQTYWTKPQTQAGMLAIIQAQKSDFEPDAKAEYSNTNFVLLGYIIEKLWGMTYADALKRYVTSKAGLTDTYYGGKINPANNEAESFSYKGGWTLKSETDMSIPGGAGAIVSTPADLVKFLDALFGGKLISAQSLGLMKTIRDGYGMAMFPMPFYERTAYGHTGGIDGFTSVVSYFPDEKLAVAWCSNGSVYSTNNILIGVLSIYFNKPYVIPTFQTIKLSPAELDGYTGTYSSTQLALKITFTRQDTTLVAQATSQPAFALTATAPYTFEFSPAGIVIAFDPANQSFVLRQGGQSFKFTRDK
ncbi:MAG TPA: serine hydrolase domain-containing protein [Mucilaginibacter sp.]|nr:serine hydrolase domain-containing protein [Mucilaginibacter sp.]